MRGDGVVVGEDGFLFNFRGAVEFHYCSFGRQLVNNIPRMLHQDPIKTLLLLIRRSIPIRSHRRRGVDSIIRANLRIHSMRIHLLVIDLDIRRIKRRIRRATAVLSVIATTADVQEDTASDDHEEDHGDEGCDERPDVFWCAGF